MSKRGNKDSESLPVHGMVFPALTAGALALQLSPSSIGSTRAAAVADNWAHFRVRKFKFRLHPSPLAASGQALGYVGGQQDTPPATTPQIMELIPSVFISTAAPAANAPNRTTQPTEWVNIPRSDLAGPFPWYKSLPGGADVTEEAPGILVGAGTATEAMVIEYRGLFEFKTSVAPANTPAAVDMRARLRAERVNREKEHERMLLLGILSTQPVITQLPSGRLVAQV